MKSALWLFLLLFAFSCAPKKDNPFRQVILIDIALANREAAQQGESLVDSLLMAKKAKMRVRVLFPGREVEGVVHSIRGDTLVLVDAFETVFPTFDLPPERMK